MNDEVVNFTNTALKAGKSIALVILTESESDTPGITGALMAYSSDGEVMGTIGGGKVEAQVIEKCEKVLKDPLTSTTEFLYNLNEKDGMDMLCGGQMKGVITIIKPRCKLIIFGGGHVAQKLYESAIVAGFNVYIIEDRKEFSVHFPKATYITTNSENDLNSVSKSLLKDGQNYVAIVTRGHANDFEALSSVIESNSKYIGMIGSRKKVKALLEKLRQQGVQEDRIEKLYTPIGLTIDDGTPGEIAIGIMAEILSVKNNTHLFHSREQRNIN